MYDLTLRGISRVRFGTKTRAEYDDRHDVVILYLSCLRTQQRSGRTKVLTSARQCITTSRVAGVTDIILTNLICADLLYTLLV